MPAAIHSSQEACKKEIEGTASIRLITVDPSQLARHTPVLIFFLYEYWSCEISKHYFYYTRTRYCAVEGFCELGIRMER